MRPIRRAWRHRRARRAAARLRARRRPQASTAGPGWAGPTDRIFLDGPLTGRVLLDDPSLDRREGRQRLALREPLRRLLQRQPGAGEDLADQRRDVARADAAVVAHPAAVSAVKAGSSFIGPATPPGCRR